MSYTGPCEWILKLSAFCDPKLDWKNPDDMHRRCRGIFIARNPPPSGLGRVYGRCFCPCHGKLDAEGIQKISLSKDMLSLIRTSSNRNGSLGAAHSISKRNASASHGRPTRTQLPRKSVDFTGVPTLREFQSKRKKRKKK